VGHDYALNFNGRHPLSTAFNDILAAICYLEVPVTVYCGHIAGGEPVLLQRGILLMLQSVMKTFEAAYITGYTSPAMGFNLEVPMVKQLSSRKASLQFCTELAMWLSPGPEGSQEVHISCTCGDLEMPKAVYCGYIALNQAVSSSMGSFSCCRTGWNSFGQHLRIALNILDWRSSCAKLRHMPMQHDNTALGNFLHKITALEQCCCTPLT